MLWSCLLVLGLLLCFHPLRCTGLQDKVCVQSEGVNFSAVWAMSDVFDVCKIGSNDVAAILAYAWTTGGVVVSVVLVVVS